MRQTKFDLTTEETKRKSADRNSLKFLKQYQVEIIDEALCSLGEFGELRLIVEKCRLRFLVVQRSYDVLKLDPQELKEERI